MTRFAILAVLLPALLPAWAHEGHDHGAAVREPRLEAAPRASAESEEFELVAVLEKDGGLTLYLDRHATGEPVADARIELESGAFKALAQAREAGVYAVAGEALRAPGRHPLTLTVTAGNSVDLLAATLDVPQARAASATQGKADLPSWATWVAGGLLALGLVFFLIRKRGGKA